jgi:hypothetical protein
MKYRLASILAHEDITVAGTKTLDVSLRDVISRINIQVKATNNGSAPTAHPASIISKIEVVDGSDVLWGLSGQEALACQFFHTRQTPFCVNNYLDNVMNITNYELNFGRFLYDPIVALNPNKFRNPQLKVTHNKANGGSAPDACTLEVTADVFDQKEADPLGFLMAKENVSYTLSANANEYIDLPTDHALRKLIIMSLSPGKQPWEQFNEVKLSEDNDKKVPIDDKTSDLLKYFGNLWPPLDEYIVGAALTTTRNFYMMSSYEVVAAAMATDFGAAYMKSDLSYGGRIDIRGLIATNFMARIRGFAPFGSLCIPFGDQANNGDWFDVTNIGNLRLTLKAGSSPGASSTCEVITEQLRKY